MHSYNSSPYYSTSGDPYAAHERESSDTGSEANSNYDHYVRGLKDDTDFADDPHLSLTSQSLNADGTPKRPMNAFMIFARKRRPEISSANQMMRTGDVSKILSREWNSMPMSEKKFYLDQAKKLKDTFNTKYPDYVYRRRPNNSRKKRKTDVEHETSPEHSPGVETSIDELSPISSEELTTHHASRIYHHDSQSPNSHASYTDYNSQAYLEKSPSSMPGRYSQVPSQVHLYASSVHNAPSGAAVLVIPRPPFGDSPTSSGYQSPHSSAASPPSSYAEDPNAQQASWCTSRESSGLDHSRSAWPLLPALDTGPMRQRSNNPHVPAIGSEQYTPQFSQRSWPHVAHAIHSPSSSYAASRYANAAGHPSASVFGLNPSAIERAVDLSPTNRAASENYSASRDLQRDISATDKHAEHRASLHSNLLPLPMSNAYATIPEHLGQWQSQPRAGTAIGSQMFSSATASAPSLSSAPTLYPPSGSGGDSTAQCDYLGRGRYDNR